MATWMLAKMESEGCLYQVDAVDHLLRLGVDRLLEVNPAGNDVLSRKVLDAFRRVTESTVVWVKQERYWRPREAGDPPGRVADW